MKKWKIPFWLQILLILLAGVSASVVALHIVEKGNETKKNEILEKHTVTFAYLDGTIIETREVSHGKGVFPPKLTAEGVFRGWSNSFNKVISDVEVHPVYHRISEGNLFYFHSQYVQEGKNFVLDVYVGGRVSVSSGRLTLQYDPDVLKYVESEDMEECRVSEGARGELLVEFNFEEPLKMETLLSGLKFKAQERDAYATEILLSASDVMVVTRGKEIPADCATINNKIFFLQEVEE